MQLFVALDKINKVGLFSSLVFFIFLPPNSLSKEQTFAEFESLTARFADLAYISCDNKTAAYDFVMQKECFSAINKLLRHHSIIIIILDKSSGVVILTKSDYTGMNSILH